jgi:hypothetical protein
MQAIFYEYSYMKKIAIFLAVLGWAFTFNFLFISEFKEYEKFHFMISPESNYFPTIDETIRNVDIKKNKGKKFIVIGGSSASAGVGQTYSNLWSTQLQNELGAEYKVINSAMNGGSFYELGLYQAKYLADSGEKVMYIFDGPPTGGSTITSRWSYIVINACLRGYEKNLALCNDYIKNLWNGDAGSNKILWKYLIDGVIPNQNFWNYISYNFFQFQFNRYLTKEKLLSSRSKYGVVERNDKAGNKCFTDKTDEQIKNDLDLYRGNILSFCFKKDNNCSVDGINEAVDKTFKYYPDILKGKTIATLSQSTPFLHDKLDLNDSRLMNDAWKIAAARIREFGIYALPEYSSDWDKCDFGDRVHWSDEGARRHKDHVIQALKDIGF